MNKVTRCSEDHVDAAAASTVLLIRHAHTAAVGHRLSGRTDVELTAAGTLQAERLGRALAPCRLAAVYTSPLVRAVHTAQAIADIQKLTPQREQDLQEIDFGRWTGQEFDALRSDPAWQHFNERRATAVIPDGESLRGVQARIVQAITRLSRRHPRRAFGIVSHADVIRFALLHFVEATLDEYARFAIEPASVSVVSLHADAGRVLVVNDTTGRYARRNSRTS